MAYSINVFHGSHYSLSVQQIHIMATVAAIMYEVIWAKDQDQ